MGRVRKDPAIVVAPVSSKKQLMGIGAVCRFMDNISHDALDNLRNDPGKRFPKPLQILSGSPMWSVDQIEKYVERKEKEVENLHV